jgi:hypothetical protein
MSVCAKLSITSFKNKSIVLLQTQKQVQHQVNIDRRVIGEKIREENKIGLKLKFLRNTYKILPQKCIVPIKVGDAS